MQYSGPLLCANKDLTAPHPNPSPKGEGLSAD
jgi:hypothetical protein